MTDTKKNRSLGASVRLLRTNKGMTVEALAEAASLSTAMISKIENGKGNPSINSLRKIAKALEVPMAFFFAQEDLEPEEAAVNKKRVYLDSRSSASYTASISPVSDNVSFFMIECKPGAAGGSEPVGHIGFEQGIVIEGELEMTVGDQVHQLKPYDTISFPSKLPHRWANKGDVVARSIWVVYLDKSDMESLLPTSELEIIAGRVTDSTETYVASAVETYIVGTEE